MKAQDSEAGSKSGGTIVKTLSAVNEKIGHYRWVICGLLFFATTINYLDRSVMGLLKGTISDELGWTESDYSMVVNAFQAAYAISLIFAGKVIDRIGTKLGYGLALTVWSIAAIVHGFATGTNGFMAARALLGVGESGNFPAANKTIAEWFPKKERAFATGLYNSGSNIGAVVAPLMVPWIAVHIGWQWAFILTGTIGLIWLLFWWVLYADPAGHKRLKKPEYDYIHSEDAAEEENEETAGTVVREKVTWSKVLRCRQTWAFFFGKFFTDPVWWFFLFWLPAFLESEYHLTGMQVSVPLIVVYTLSSIGSIVGGWLPKYFIDKGWTAGRARKISMLIYAFIPLSVLLALKAGEVNMWFAILIIGMACAAHCAWSANIFTTVSDMFPKRAVATVTGIGSMAGTAGGIIMAFAVGKILDAFKAAGNISTGYGLIFGFCSAAYLVAWLLTQLFAPNFKKADKTF